MEETRRHESTLIPPLSTQSAIRVLDDRVRSRFFSIFIPHVLPSPSSLYATTPLCIQDERPSSSSISSSSHWTTAAQRRTFQKLDTAMGNVSDSCPCQPITRTEGRIKYGSLARINPNSWRNSVPDSAASNDNKIITSVSNYNNKRLTTNRKQNNPCSLTARRFGNHLNPSSGYGPTVLML